jgi:transcriptional regulator with XRE-family HTH domain
MHRNKGDAMEERTKLMQLRARKCWSQSQAAAFIGVDEGTYRKWEQGITIPRPTSMQLLCEAFECTVAELGIQMLHASAFPLRLKRLRKAKHWTQEQAADFAGVSARAWISWESGAITPRDSNLQQICEAFGCSFEDLGLDENTDPATSDIHAPLLSAFLTHDLSMRLLPLAFIARRSFAEVQERVSQTLQEFDAMNIDPISRREALKRLAVLTIIPSTLGGTSQPLDGTLNQCAASIVACQELGHSTEAADLALAFEGASTAIQQLQPIMRDLSKYRKAAASLASQAARLQNVLAGHLESPDASIPYGKQAVLYSKESGDIPEYLMTLMALAWAYESVPRYTVQALQTMEQAVLILNEQRAKVPLYIHGQIYSVLAVMQAKNGRPSSDTLRLAVKNAFADQGYAMFVDDPLYSLTINEAEALAHHGDYSAAQDALVQLVDSATLSAKRSLSERGYIRALSNMMTVSLKVKNKDLERSARLWQVTMQKTKALKSERRFDDMVFSYHIMESVWSNEKHIQELRPLTIHW